MKKIINTLYLKTGSIDETLQYYAGILGIYNMYYGHKVDAKKRANWNRAKRYLIKKVNGDE